LVRRGFRKIVPLCHASSIVFDGRALSWFGPEGATWSVPVDRLRAIREVVAQSGDTRWLLAFDIDGEEGWLQSPANANGMEQALVALGTRLAEKLDLQLERAPGGSERVVWSRTKQPG
jgi:hypothetical protein